MKRLLASAVLVFALWSGASVAIEGRQGWNAQIQAALNAIGYITSSNTFVQWSKSSVMAASSYLNFGASLDTTSVAGANGYGLRDNAGIIEIKNSGGAWASVVSGSNPIFGTLTVTGWGIVGGTARTRTDTAFELQITNGPQLVLTATANPSTNNSTEASIASYGYDSTGTIQKIGSFSNEFVDNTHGAYVAKTRIFGTYGTGQNDNALVIYGNNGIDLFADNTTVGATPGAGKLRVNGTMSVTGAVSTGALNVTGNMIATASVNAAATSGKAVGFNGSTLFDSVNIDGVVELTKNDQTTGVRFNAATAGVFQVLAVGGADTATFKVATVSGGRLITSASTGTTVANVGANSCGTTAATVAGNETNGVITVGATAGTQCRVAFTTAATTARDCTVSDSTTTIATRSTYVDTTHTDFFGAFVAGDKVTFICIAR